VEGGDEFLDEVVAVFVLAEEDEIKFYHIYYLFLIRILIQAFYQLLKTMRSHLMSRKFLNLRQYPLQHQLPLVHTNLLHKCLKHIIPIVILHNQS
jgi:hypothetical protein